VELTAGVILGRYEIEGLIAHGGLSSVFLANDSELRRRVQIKISHPELRLIDSTLLNEARILAQLQHPAIHNILDIGRDNRVLYLVLEHLDGGTLRDTLIKENIQLVYERVLTIVATVADALDYVHRRGYVHRNIKPRVILQDSAGQPRLSGFEIAVAKAEMASAEMAGTVSYMAPEQLTGSSELLGPHTDVWGLGATLYEALTGRPPYNPHSLSDLLQEINTSTLPPPSEINSAIPAELDRICLKCLAKRPEDRYSNAALLASDLRQQSTQPREQRRVFVSHSTKDREFVEREIISQLEQNGIKTWYSKVDIQTAAEWERSILHGLESCPWFLLVMSPKSVSSEWVKDELTWAIDKRPNRIVPVLIEDCELRDFHIRLARIQYVDFRTPSREVRAQLMKLFEAGAA
jgi:serine/threonine protein kinase